MPFDRPTLQTIVDRIEGDIKTRVDNASSFLRRSVFKVLARAYAAVVYTLYGFLNFIKDQLFATSADAEYLEIIGLEYGISRKASTYAKGECRATGTAGYTISAATRLQYSDGQVYLVDNDVILNLSGYADLSITAEIAGANGNQDPGGILSFVSPLIGIDSTATIDSLGITGGVDQESDDDLRARILERKRQPPHGGAEFDYKNWALEVPGVTRAWTFPQYQGIGTIGVAFVRDNDDNTIIPNSAQMQEVYDYICNHTDPITGLSVGAPVTAQAGLFVIALTLQSLDMTVLLNPNNASTQNYASQEIDNLLLDKGGPGETLIYSDMIKYIANAVGVIGTKVIIPSDDVAFAVNRVPVKGTITFGAY